LRFNSNFRFDLEMANLATNNMDEIEADEDSCKSSCVHSTSCCILIYATTDEADVYMFYRCFFLFFSVRHKNTRQPFSETAERIFMKLLRNDSGENVVSNVVPKWGLGPQIILWGLKTTHCALGGDAW